MNTLPFYPARPKQGGRNFLDVHAALYSKGDWLVTPKFNGWRALLHAPTGTMWNRHGAQLSISGEFTEAIQQIQTARENAMRAIWDVEEHGILCLTPGEADWYDVEALDRRHQRGRGSLVVLDLPLLGLDFGHRHRVIKAMFSLCAVATDSCVHPNAVYHCPAYTGSSGTIWDQLQWINQHLGITFYEGVVVKRRTSTYPLQLRSPAEETADWIKHRFTTK